LTEKGSEYLERCKRILGDLEEAEAALADDLSTPSGRLIISAPVLFGRMYLAPLLVPFIARQPRVTLEVSLSDPYSDLVAQHIDVAVRIGRLEDSSMVARRLGMFRRVVCAAPSYLEQHGIPKHPNDLADHQCLIFTMLTDPVDWTFRGSDGGDITVRVKGCVRSDNADVVLQAALAGGGLVLAPTWQVRPHVGTGGLVPVLRGFEQPAAPIHAVYPHARLLSAKVRSFVDFLLETWRHEDFATLPRLNSGA
jgi:DNA-binding transcriptional LysR family regulator